MRNKSKFLVVCHDTGGAEIISAFVKLRKKKNDCICFISGPAVKIFRRKKIKISIIRPVINIERVLKKYQQMMRRKKMT